MNSYSIYDYVKKLEDENYILKEKIGILERNNKYLLKNLSNIIKELEEFKSIIDKIKIDLKA